MPTIKSALLEAVEQLRPKSDSALIDAEILLCKILDKDRSYLRAWPERELTDAQCQAFAAKVNKRRQGEPVAYLTGVREFWSRKFIVTPDVLIPRHETELIIELSLEFLPADQPVNILDLGTGSGILAITLAAERPNANIIALDISPAALAVAGQNAAMHKVNNVEFRHSDWFVNLGAEQFDLIVSNPPYLAEDDPHLQEGDLRFEPGHALVAKQDGLADIAAIAEDALPRLTKGGRLLVEHGLSQHVATQEIFTRAGFVNVCTHNDLAALPRVTLGQAPSI